MDGNEGVIIGSVSFLIIFGVTSLGSSIISSAFFSCETVSGLVPAPYILLIPPPEGVIPVSVEILPEINPGGGDSYPPLNGFQTCPVC